MVTIGDSFAVVALLGGICLSAWALIMAVALVFPARAQMGRERLVSKPWASFLIGMLLWATIGFLSVVLLASPLPPAKLLGWMGILSLASIAAVGSAGLASLASERLSAMAPDATPYVSLSKSAATIVIASLVPILGWFLIVPFLVFASTGAGVAALRHRQSGTAEVPGFMP